MIAKTENRKKIAIITLVIATALWGSTFALTKALTDYLSPLELITVRFLLAALCMLPLFVKPIVRGVLSMNRTLLLWLLLFGMVNFFSIFLQTVGLSLIDASNSGFITSLSTLFVPVIEYFIRKKKVSSNIRIALFVAFAGVYLLSYGFSLPQAGSWGDLLTLLCALLYGFYIIIVDIISKKIEVPFIMFTAFLITGLSGALVWLFSSVNEHGNVYSAFSTLSKALITPTPLLLLALLVIGGTVIPYTLMGLGQKQLDAQTSALVYLLEPVFATLFALLMGLEALTPYKIAGGLLILAGQYIAIGFTFRSKKDDSTVNAES